MAFWPYCSQPGPRGLGMLAGTENLQPPYTAYNETLPVNCVYIVDAEVLGHITGGLPAAVVDVVVVAAKWPTDEGVRLLELT